MLKIIKNRDLQLLLFINQGIKCRVLDKLFPSITYLGSMPFCIFFCIFSFIASLMLSLDNFKIIVVKIAATLILSTITCQVLKRKFVRTRPFDMVDGIYINKIQIDKYSFPSGHTTAAFSIAVSLALFYTYLSPILLTLCLLVALSRIYLGVHYPSDVLAGSLIGTIISSIIYMVL